MVKEGRTWAELTLALLFESQLSLLVVVLVLASTAILASLYETNLSAFKFQQLSSVPAVRRDAH